MKSFVILACTLLVLVFVSGCTFPSIFGDNLNFDPAVIADRTSTPATHALFGIVAVLPGNGTYCIFSETLSRGEPVRVGLHYRIAVPTTGDRFGSTTYVQRGKSFITDNDHVVNETVLVPEGAIDSIVTVSYDYYTDYNQVHTIVKRCD